MIGLNFCSSSLGPDITRQLLCRTVESPDNKTINDWLGGFTS